MIIHLNLYWYFSDKNDLQMVYSIHPLKRFKNGLLTGINTWNWFYKLSIVQHGIGVYILYICYLIKKTDFSQLRICRPPPLPSPSEVTIVTRKIPSVLKRMKNILFYFFELWLIVFIIYGWHSWMSVTAQKKIGGGLAPQTPTGATSLDPACFWIEDPSLTA